MLFRRRAWGSSLRIGRVIDVEPNTSLIGVPAFLDYLLVYAGCMGFLDRFRNTKELVVQPTPFNRVAHVFTGSEPDIQNLPAPVVDALKQITVTFGGPYQNVTGLPVDEPTIPVGGTVRAVGTSYYSDSFQRLTGGARDDGFRAGCTASLIPEPDNPYDSEAIAIRIGGLAVGHLSRDDARDYRSMIDTAIDLHGVASVSAAIVGGWRRGDEVGDFGVELRFSDRPDRAADAGPDEIRLRGSGTVSVSNEEDYQPALLAATKGRSLATYSYPAVAELVETSRNPHVKKDTGPVLEVRVLGSTVGFLTPKMTSRFVRVSARARQEDKRLTCSASIFESEKAGERIAEIRLSACPHAADERFVVDPYFEFAVDLIRNRKSRSLHRIKDRSADGTFRTACGVNIAVADAECFASTKPWVGYVIPETKEIVREGSHDQCQRCV